PLAWNQMARYKTAGLGEPGRPLLRQFQRGASARLRAQGPRALPLGALIIATRTPLCRAGRLSAPLQSVLGAGKFDLRQLALSRQFQCKIALLFKAESSGDENGGERLDQRVEFTHKAVVPVS